MTPSRNKSVAAALLALLALVLALHGPAHEADDPHEGAECVLCLVSVDDFDDPPPSVVPALGAGEFARGAAEETIESAPAALRAARGPPATLA